MEIDLESREAGVKQKMFEESVKFFCKAS